jgi:hypothetical protein
VVVAHPLLEVIKASVVGEFVRSSSWAFPALESLHFIGMALLVGIVGAIDLRILGVARGLPVYPLHRLLPLAFVGFGINALTGAMFFAHDPYAYAFNASFHLKMLFIVLAALNALWFRLSVFAHIDKWGADVEGSPLAKRIATLSLLLWVAVIVAGRYIAFVKS